MVPDKYAYQMNARRKILIGHPYRLINQMGLIFSLNYRTLHIELWVF